MLRGSTARDEALSCVDGPIHAPLALFDFEEGFDFAVELWVLGDRGSTVKWVRCLSEECRPRLEASRRHLINLYTTRHRSELALMPVWNFWFKQFV